MGSGGMRVGAGRPQKGVEDKILDGVIQAHNVKLLESENSIISKRLNEIDGEEIDSPVLKDYMLRPQQDVDNPINAGEEIKDIYKWVFSMGCSDIVPTQLLEQYAMNRARWIQCQNGISKIGFIVKSPKSGRPIKNPYVEIMLEVEKQMNNTFLIINQIVKEHCLSGYQEYQPDDTFYENLLD